MDALTELQQSFEEFDAQVKQEPVEITKEMVFAFHHALTDGDLPQSDFQEIEIGLKAAFAHISQNPDRAEELAVIQHESDCVEAAKERIAELEARADALANALDGTLDELRNYYYPDGLDVIANSHAALDAYRASKKGGA